MTDEEIKVMLKDIIDNGAEYEFRWLRTDGWSDWKSYRLGEEILCNDSRYEYRKVENWSVIEWKDTHKLEIRPLKKAEKNTIGAFIQITFKTKEECEKWIEAHIKKTWLEEYLENYFTEHTEYSLSRRGDLLGGIRIGATEVCKKILEEMENRALSGVGATTLRNIFKDLGVEV